MLRWFCLLACFCLAFNAAIAHADTVTLRPRVEASGPAILLGDVFDGAGAAGSRAIAPSPPAGQMSTLSIPLLVAVASAAGLEWTPPPGAAGVRVVRPGGARATLAPESNATNISAGDAAIRRGQTVTLVYEVPGVQLTTSARAMDDGAVGQQVRLVNLTSNRTITAIVTGPSTASAQP